jgi:hypothetical protein
MPKPPPSFNLHSPVTADQLAQIPPGTTCVQFSASLTEDDFRLLADFFRSRPEICLRSFTHWGALGEERDVDFLVHFPFLKRLEIGIFRLRDLSGIAHVTKSLEEFTFAQTSRPWSLSFLADCKRLKLLYIEKQPRDIEVLGELKQLEDLTLRSITLPDLSLLVPLRKLLSLDIKLGGTSNLRLLPEIGRLRYLELWQILGLADLDVLAEVTTLQSLNLQAIKQVKRLASFEPLKRLRRVYLEKMSGISDLSPLAAAPALEELAVYDMKHLQPADFQCFVGHRRLKGATIELGSVRKNREIAALLQLPAAPSSVDFQFK